MMVGLFIIFLICLLLVAFAKKKAAFWLVVINLGLCVLLLIHHATDVLNIRL